MYYRRPFKEEVDNIPFKVQCRNCGSHNVDVIALEHLDLQISCRHCGSYLLAGSYNETAYTEKE